MSEQFDPSWIKDLKPVSEGVSVSGSVALEKVQELEKALQKIHQKEEPDGGQLAVFSPKVRTAGMNLLYSGLRAALEEKAVHQGLGYLPGPYGPAAQFVHSTIRGAVNNGLWGQDQAGQFGVVVQTAPGAQRFVAVTDFVNWLASILWGSTQKRAALDVDAVGDSGRFEDVTDQQGARSTATGTQLALMNGDDGEQGDGLVFERVTDMSQLD